MRIVKPKKRQKLCHHCEGEVDLDVIVCPFCAADLREEKPEQHKSAFSPAVSSVKQIHTEQSLYPPPYLRTHEEEPAPTYAREPVETQTAPSSLSQEETEEQSSLKPTLLGISLFTLGVHFFLIGLMMFFFSDRGVLILRWNASFWVFYLLASLPLLAFGYRALNKL